jgi:hypothetical protein
MFSKLPNLQALIDLDGTAPIWGILLSSREPAKSLPSWSALRSFHASHKHLPPASCFASSYTNGENLVEVSL